MLRLNCSSYVSWLVSRNSTARVTPALLTSTSSPPSHATASSTTRWHVATSVRSPPTANALPPSRSISATASSAPRSLCAYWIATVYPCRASSSAIPCPIPIPAPVTSANRFPCSLIMASPPNDWPKSSGHQFFTIQAPPSPSPYSSPFTRRLLLVARCSLLLPPSASRYASHSASPTSTAVAAALSASMEETAASGVSSTSAPIATTLGHEISRQSACLNSTIPAR